MYNACQIVIVIVKNELNLRMEIIKESKKMYYVSLSRVYIIINLT